MSVVSNPFLLWLEAMSVEFSPFSHFPWIQNSIYHSLMHVSTLCRVFLLFFHDHYQMVHNQKIEFGDRDEFWEGKLDGCR